MEDYKLRVLRASHTICVYYESIKREPKIKSIYEHTLGRLFMLLLFDAPGGVAFSCYNKIHDTHAWNKG